MDVIHAFVRLCMALNGTMCVEQEIVPENYRAITSIMDCAMGGMIFMTGATVDRAGMRWLVKGVRCSNEGAMPTTDIQARLRASVQ